MANIKITVDGPLVDGHKITFKAPCGCGTAEKLNVFYIEEGTQKNRLFTLKDSNNNSLGGKTSMFAKDAYVSVVLDTNKSYAFVQNPGSSVKTESDMAILRETLLPGEGGIVFMDPRITKNSALSFYTSIYGINPKKVIVNEGSVNLEFDSIETEIEVGVRIDG